MQHWCNLAAKESRLECACMNNDDFTVLVSGGGRRHWVSTCTVWVCIKNDWASNESVSNFVKIKHYSVETIQMTQKAAAMGSWLLAASSQHTCSCITSHAEFLVKHQITEETQPPYSPDLAPCDFRLIPKLKSLLKGRDIRQLLRFRKIQRSSDGDGENCVRSQGAYFEGDWGIIVLCMVFLVSCIFFNKCLYFS